MCDRQKLQHQQVGGASNELSTELDNRIFMVDIQSGKRVIGAAEGQKLATPLGHVTALEKLPVDNLKKILPLLQVDKFGAIVTDGYTSVDYSSYGSALTGRVDNTRKGSTTSESLAPFDSAATSSSSCYSRPKVEGKGLTFSNSSVAKFEDPNFLTTSATLPNSGKRAAILKVDPRPHEDNSLIIHDNDDVDLITRRYPAVKEIPNPRLGSKPSAVLREELAAHALDIRRSASGNNVFNPWLDPRLPNERRKSNSKLPVAQAAVPNLDSPVDVQARRLVYNTSKPAEHEYTQQRRRSGSDTARPLDPSLQGTPQAVRRFRAAAQGSIPGDAAGSARADVERRGSPGEERATCSCSRSNIETHAVKASSERESFLRQRMDERRKIQDTATARAATTSAQLPMYDGTSLGISNPYVISPEDLIHGSLKNYCGVVLDPQTREYLGTAVLFVPPDPGQQGPHFPRSGKSAWVTSVKVVLQQAAAGAGTSQRSQVLLRNSRGETHAAQVLLTSQAFGLAFLSVHTWPGTFGLAFLRIVAGPSSLPHRLFVDPQYGDRVYILGYEINQESGLADLRLRPAKVINSNSVHGDAVKVDFTAGQLGGSLTSPMEFMGGLVVRADGFWIGLITCNALPHHAELADFVSAYNIYSLLEEL